MRPLDLLTHPELSELSPPSDLDQRLRGSPPDQVQQELDRLKELSLSERGRAALTYGIGALALRRGRLNDAVEQLDEAADALRACELVEAATLARCEAWLARIRRGPRKVYPEAVVALTKLAAGAPDNARIAVVCDHYRGTALRYAGQTEATLEALLAAFERSDGLLIERGQVLNSLGTLYQVLGAYGAAQAALEHAAEINHQVGDLVSEAISYGQLGSAALARDEQELARKHLQRQQWLASRVGDTFGEARSLVFLADLAIAMGRPDDALSLAQQASEVAGSVTPPLGMWVAYAMRSEGRARVELGRDGAVETLRRASERFAAMGNQLGEALVDWDLALARSWAGKSVVELRGLGKPTWALASLGLTGRMAQLLHDLRRNAKPDERHALDSMIAACGQVHPHVTTTHEVDLVLKEPHVLADIAARRIAAQRNLGRLTACRLSTPGLYLAAVASDALRKNSALPSLRSAATLLGQLPGVALLLWRGGTSAQVVARDLAALRASLGEDTRAALGWFAEARVASTPFAGEPGVALQGADTDELLAAALAAPAGRLCVLPFEAWDHDCAGLVALGGFEAQLQSS